MSARRRFLRGSAAALIAVAAFAASASSANAGVLVAAAPSCDDQALSKPFAPWLDLADYTPLPGGDFEGSTAGWSTTGGAAVANGNSPFRVGGASDAKSLSLPNGSSATSAPICVGLEHPTVRLFAKRTSGGLLGTTSTLRVDVLFELSSGDVMSLPVGDAVSTGSWQPTAPMLAVANLLPLLPGERTAVAFRFTAQGANWSVDDVYVDPFNRK